MGRIKTKLVKGVTKKLVAKHSESFTDNFAENKQHVGQFAEIRSPKMKNLIAGYLTRLMKNKKEL